MKIQLFSLSGLWCGLQKFLWPFSFFWDPWCLRSPVVCKKSFFWTGFHFKKLTNKKSHSTSLWSIPVLFISVGYVWWCTHIRQHFMMCLIFLAKICLIPGRRIKVLKKGTTNKKKIVIYLLQYNTSE